MRAHSLLGAQPRFPPGVLRGWHPSEEGAGRAQRPPAAQPLLGSDSPGPPSPGAGPAAMLLSSEERFGENRC